MVGRGPLLCRELSRPFPCRLSRDNEREVFAELIEIVDEVLAHYKKEGKPLPPSTSGKDYANKMLTIA